MSRLASSRRATLRALVLAALLLPAGASSQSRIVVKVATDASSGSPLTVQLHALERYLADETAGRLDVEVFTDGALGDATAVTAGLREGTIQAYAGRVEVLQKMAPELLVLRAPDLFPGAERAHRMLHGPLVRHLRRSLVERGLVFGGWGPGSFTMWFATRPPGTTNPPAESMRVVALRRGETERLQAQGFTPVGVPASRVREALRHGHADAVELTASEALATGWFRAAPHVLATQHAFAPRPLVFSQRWFQGLPDALQRLLVDLPDELTEEARRMQREATSRWLEGLQRMGVTIHAPQGRQRPAGRRFSRKAQQAIAERLGPRAQALLRAAKSN